MASGIRTIIFPVKDLAQAKALYSTILGVAPIADQAYYLGFKVDGQDIGFVPQEHNKGMTGPLCYFHVDDIEASPQQFLDAGAQPQQAVKDIGGGRLIASVLDADGNTIGLIQDP